MLKTLHSAWLIKWELVENIVGRYLIPFVFFLLAFHRRHTYFAMGNHGIIKLLFESPSGFAIFSFDGTYLEKENAVEVLN